jgi:hypothetical protein
LGLLISQAAGGSNELLHMIESPFAAIANFVNPARFKACRVARCDHDAMFM